MDRTRLLQYFETLADTPEAVEKLRKLVLDFAIRGRLAPQQPNDEPAIQLVERAKAVLAKNRKKSYDQNNDKPEVLPFSLAKNWCWTRLEELGDTAPRNELDDKTEVGFSPMRLVTAKFGEPILFECKTWSEVRKGFTHFADGDVVSAKITPCFENGKSGVIRGAPNGFGAGTTELHVLRPVANCVLPEYVLIFLKSPHFLLNGEKHMTGSAGQKRVPWNYFAKTPFPLPPFPEQRRIVAKVEELLALGDELEARQTAAREHRARLVHSALDRLTTPSRSSRREEALTESPPDRSLSGLTSDATTRRDDNFRRHAQFVLREFPHLTAASEDVPALRQAILSLAMQGRIVSREPKEGAGADVIRRFSLRTMPDNGHSIDEAFPAHWAIAAFSNLARIRSGVTKGRNLTGRKTAVFPYLRVANVQRGHLDLDIVKDIEIPVEELGRYRLEPNDLLITEGGDWDKVGRTAIWQAEIPDCIHQNHIFRARLIAEELRPEWYMLYLNSPIGRRYFESAAKQTTNLASINATELRECPIPIPPIAEQHRIVAKVDELMRWCDQLEEHLTTARTTASHLLDATIQQILTA